MTDTDIALKRMWHRRISGPDFEKPAQVVQWMGAVQAQDYGQALWAVALRTVAATQADIEQAIAERSIVLTWPMRGTLHLVTASEVRWLLELCASRKLAADGSRLRQLELDEPILGRCTEVLSRALEGGKVLTRSGAALLWPP